MPLETDFRNRFLKCLPRLLKNKAFKNEVSEGLGNRGAEILERVLSRFPLDAADEDELFDAAHNAYTDSADQILTLGWDGDAPGMSGAIWVECCEGIYVIRSSDFDDLGPFSSLEETLDKECLNTVTAKPELESKSLPKKKLLEIAGQVVDWENKGTIRVNSVTYRVSGDKLILGDG